MPPAETEILKVTALSPQTWHHFEALFGPKGACGNCWCMFDRLPKTEFTEGKHNDGNKLAMKNLVTEGKPTGVMGFVEGEPVAWCSLAPRPDFLRLKNSRVHKPIDDEEVWSITCFFVAKNYRRMGLSVAMLKGVIEYAREQGIKILEAYPTIPTTEKLPDSFLWIGLYKSFERAGFKVVDRTSKHRPMVRYYV